MIKGFESCLLLLSVDFGKFVVLETFWWGKFGASCCSGWVGFWFKFTGEMVCHKKVC